VKATTLRDVAREAGVSVSTVSRVLNDQPFVRAEVRDKVISVSEALGYRPDVAARSMRTGTTGAVGLVVSDISNPLFASIAKAADLALSPRGYALMVANSANDPAHEAELIAALRQRRLDGLMIATASEQTPSLSERIGGFQAAVLLDRELPGARFDAVLSDHASGLADALRHLARLGHRRIALIAGSVAQRGSRVRVEAYRREVVGLGLDRDDDLCRDGALTQQDGYRALGEVLALPDPPTAIVAGNNQLFAGLFAAIRDLDIAVPSALSVVACEETELTALHNPPLDVIRRDVAELGRLAAELLLARLGQPSRRRREIVLPAVFEARGSSAPPAALGVRKSRAHA
jgi:LacI family transcriptional regulator, galactose operon repressor